MISGVTKSFRGKVIDQNGREFIQADRQGIKVTAELPYFKKCGTRVASMDSNGIFQFSLPILNGTIPYIMSVNINKGGLVPVNFEYIVGGNPQQNSEVVELGQYRLIKPENKGK
jgi:hypothetical protein